MRKLFRALGFESSRQKVGPPTRSSERKNTKFWDSSTLIKSLNLDESLNLSFWIFSIFYLFMFFINDRTRVRNQKRESKAKLIRLKIETTVQVFRYYVKQTLVIPLEMYLPMSLGFIELRFSHFFFFLPKLWKSYGFSRDIQLFWRCLLFTLFSGYEQVHSLFFCLLVIL